MGQSEWNNTREFGAQPASVHPDIKEFFDKLHTRARSEGKGETEDDSRHPAISLVSELFDTGLGTRYYVDYQEFCNLPPPPSSPPQITVIELLGKIENRYKSFELLGAKAFEPLSKKMENPVFLDEQKFNEEVHKVQEAARRLFKEPNSNKRLKEGMKDALDLLEALPSGPMKVDSDTWDYTGQCFIYFSNQLGNFMPAQDAVLFENFGQHCMEGPFLKAAAEGKTPEDFLDDLGIEPPAESAKTIRTEKFQLSELVKTLKALQSDESMGEAEKEKARSDIRRGEALLKHTADYYTDSVQRELPGFDPKNISIPAILDMTSEENLTIAKAFYAAALTQFIIPEFQKKVLGKRK